MLEAVRLWHKTKSEQIIVPRSLLHSLQTSRTRAAFRPMEFPEGNPTIFVNCRILSVVIHYMSTYVLEDELNEIIFRLNPHRKSSHRTGIVLIQTECYAFYL